MLKVTLYIHVPSIVMEMYRNADALHEIFVHFTRWTNSVTILRCYLRVNVCTHIWLSIEIRFNFATPDQFIVYIDT